MNQAALPCMLIKGTFTQKRDRGAQQRHGHAWAETRGLPDREPAGVRLSQICHLYMYLSTLYICGATRMKWNQTEIKRTSSLSASDCGWNWYLGSDDTKAGDS